LAIKLDQARAMAFLAETTSTRNLLGYGVRVVRTGAFIETTRDPILTMLSIGVEKLYKLTIGLMRLAETEQWPSAAEMKLSGHKLAEMHVQVMRELNQRALTSTDYVRGLIREVEADPVVAPLIAALDMYGRIGRFYYLDLLGDNPQAWESPDAFWDAIEHAALQDPEVEASYAAAMESVSSNDLWDRFYSRLNKRIAVSVERLWALVAVCGRNHLLGETGGAFGFEVHPDAVGRQ
jgi:hypothetical protein